MFLDHFPEGGRQDGWIADDYLRTFLSHNGLSRVVGARSDDVFVIDDADEIPAHEGLLFLKLFDGWTEPFAIHMRKVIAIYRFLSVVVRTFSNQEVWFIIMVSLFLSSHSVTVWIFLETIWHSGGGVWLHSGDAPKCL